MKIHYLIATALLVLIPAASLAQLKPEQTLNRRAISELRFSPDGSRVTFTVNEPPKGASRSRHIWILEVGTREVRQFTNSATEFVVYPREGHGFREEKHQLDVLNRIIGWFDRHLRK